MTKRFSIKASDQTQRLADIQKKVQYLKKQLRDAEAVEVSLKAYLMPFYDEGRTEVSIGNHHLEVVYSTQERTYLDQDKARAMLARLGKKAPEFHSTITTFKIHATRT